MFFNIGRTTVLLLGAVVAVSAFHVQATENYVLGICNVVQSESGEEIFPAINGNSYLYGYHKGDQRYQGFSFNSTDTKVILVKAPAYGKVERIDSDIFENYFRYMPVKGYVGKDKFVMQVEKNGIKVRIQYLMEVVQADEPTTYIGDDGERHGYYCKPESWKISSTTSVLENTSL